MKFTVGTNKQTSEELLFESNHLVIFGEKEEQKNSLVAYPLLNQVMKEKDLGVTIFDHIGNVSKMAYAMAKRNRRKTVFFNPYMDNMKFNPIKGKEEHVIANFTAYFRDHSFCSPQMFVNAGVQLLTYALKVVKRVYKDKATLYDLHQLISNVGGRGRRMVIDFSRMTEQDSTLRKEQYSISDFFLNEYFGDKNKWFEHTFPVRIFVEELISNKTLAKIFDTNVKGEFFELDFEKHIQNKEIVIVHANYTDLGIQDAMRLMTLMSLSYQNAIARQKKPAKQLLYMKGLSVVSPLLEELFLCSEAKKVTVVTEAPNPLFLEYIDGKYKNISLLSYFPNILIMPGTHVKSPNYFGENVLSSDEISSIETAELDHDNYFYRLVDRHAKNGVRYGIAKGDQLSEEELSFLNKRIKRYQVEFSKKMM